VWFDIPLVHGRCAKFAFDNIFSVGESFFEIPFFKNNMLGDITRLVPFFACGGFFRPHIGIQYRRVIGHRFQHIHHGRQNFIFDFDQAGCFLCDMQIVGSNRSNCMSFVKHLGAGQIVAAEMIQDDSPFPQLGNFITGLRQIRTGDDGTHTRESFGF